MLFMLACAQSSYDLDSILDRPWQVGLLPGQEDPNLLGYSQCITLRDDGRIWVSFDSDDMSGQYVAGHWWYNSETEELTLNYGSSWRGIPEVTNDSWSIPGALFQGCAQPPEAEGSYFEVQKPCRDGDYVELDVNGYLTLEVWALFVGGNYEEWRPIEEMELTQDGLLGFWCNSEADKVAAYRVVWTLR